MAEITTDKLGRQTKRQKASTPENVGSSNVEATTVPEEPKMPHNTPASHSEGAPDFTTAAAAGELSAAEPTVTQASPDLPESEKPASELAGSDLQPVEGHDPQSGGPREPIPRDKPEAP